MKKKPTFLSAVLWSSLAPLAAAGILLGVFWQKLPPQVPVFYSRPWGQDQLASPLHLLVPILVAAVFLAVNLWLGFALSRPFLRQVLHFATAVASILVSVTVARIIFLVT